MEISALHQLFITSSGVNTDTRSIRKNQLFFALKGANFNGNTYALQALEEGASYAIIDEPVGEHSQFILVDDVLDTLQSLAKYHRQQFDIPVLALTGSNGKTTTKELIHAVLSSSYNVIATIGNLNNHIGVPLTLLRINNETEIAIIEMGANHQKEIASYCAYALPTHGLITNIGKAHLDGFGGEEGVLKGKMELFDFLNKDEKQLFIYSGDEKLMNNSSRLSNVKYYGKTDSYPDLFVEASFDEKCDLLKIYYRGLDIETKLVGTYNFPNVLAAICIGKYFSVSNEKIKTALENYSPDNNRSQIKRIGNNDFILDAYNANPSSMKLAIENFDSYNAAKKMMILGEMKELGEYSAGEHAAIVQQCCNTSVNDIILVGAAFVNLQQNENRLKYFESASAVKTWFDDQKISGYTILLKGSRSVGLEKIIQ